MGGFPTDIYISHGTCLKICALTSSLQSQVFFSVYHCAVCCIADISHEVTGKKFSKLVKDIFAAADTAQLPLSLVLCSPSRRPNFNIVLKFWQEFLYAKEIKKMGEQWTRSEQVSLSCHITHRNSPKYFYVHSVWRMLENWSEERSTKLSQRKTKYLISVT